MAELVTTVGVEKDEAIAGTTRRDFLGKAAATGVAVGLIAAGTERDARAAGLKKTAVPSLPARHPGADAIPLWTSQTLLNDAGGLRVVVPESRYREWLSELKRLPTRVSSRRATLLNLWVGEYAMTTGQDQRKALHHFGVAASRTKPGDALHGWARYNTCLALAFDSRYEDAANGFAALLYDHKKTGEKPLHGFDWQIAGRWLRRLSARAAEFNRLGEYGYPAPAVSRHDLRRGRPRRLPPITQAAS